MLQRDGISISNSNVSMSQILKSKLLLLQSALQLQRSAADRIELVHDNLQVHCKNRKGCRLHLKCDGTRAETRFRLSTKRTSPFKSAGASVQSTTGRRAVHISLQGLYCSCKSVFCSHVTLIGYPLHSLVSPSLLLPFVTMCHHISTGLYYKHRLVLTVLSEQPFS